MPTITLADGSKKAFDSALTVKAVAEAIGPGLAKAALAGKVDDTLVDLSFLIEQDAKVSILTEKDEDGIDVIRHSTAHLLAQAVKRLFPTAQVTIGPVIEDGFYYDFAFARPFTPEDLTAIENMMQELAKESLPVSREVMSREEAIHFFRNLGEEYKAKIIESIPEGETLSLYRQGEFVDLCRGPHVANTNQLKAFKLTKLAGAYWRGDSNNEMLQRIYGTAWGNKRDLEVYLERIAEAEKRDHRKLGRQLDLFHLQEEAPGMVFWHPDGWQTYQVVEQYLRNLLGQHGYQEIRTPQVVSRVLWEKSGHWEMFAEEMFITGSENHDFAIKPMNCPCHIQVFKQGSRSYRDLPLRLAEFGSCHRNEPSGALHGLMRLRNFVQDDAHIFCTEDQIQAEVSDFIDLLYRVYKDFGFNELIVKLSTRPQNRVGSDAIWDKAEQALAKALDSKKIMWVESPGEGAFYGPKIEFSLKDCLARVWQCGTIQVDFSMPSRLGALYTTEEGERIAPVMLHRAICGSMERFYAVLLEHYAGRFPLWLAPTQAIVLTITDNQHEFAKIIHKNLQDNGFRAKMDLRNEKIGFKIREHTIQRIPYLLVVGDKEVETKTVSVRNLSGEDLGCITIAALVERMQEECAKLSRQE